jgi:hypothetical protein
MRHTFEITEDLFDDYIRMVLFYIWDPVGVSGYRLDSDGHKALGDDIVCSDSKPAQFSNGIEDEYDSYISEVHDFILEEKSAKEIYKLLREIETKRMGDGNAAITKIAAQRLYAAGQNILRTNSTSD